MPRIEPKGGAFPYPVEIRLGAESAGESIHYTLDGSEPDLDSPQYEGPFTLRKPADLLVRAFKEGLLPSHIASASFFIYEDKKSPEVALAIANKPNELRVVFDEAVDQSSAETVTNYKVHPNITIQNARLGNDFKSVVLSTGPLSPLIDYTLSVRNIIDRSKPSNKIKVKSEKRVLYLNKEKAYGISTRQLLEPYLKMPKIDNGDFPPLLSLTGVFDDVFTLTSASGVVPYTVNTKQWNDGASMHRWIALPNSSGGGDIDSQIKFALEDAWSFPPGTVFIRHVEMVVNEQNDARQRLETQLLVADSIGGYYGVTYRWREDGRDADLVSQSQSDTLTILDRNNGKHALVWQTDRNTCMSCHTSPAGYVLGVNTRQLNGSFIYPETGINDNQLRTWNAIGMFNQDLHEQSIPSYPRLVALNDNRASLGHRVRSYFDANCSNCHQPEAVMSKLDLRFKVDLHDQGLIMVDVNNKWGIVGAKAIFPGDYKRSIVHYRVSNPTPGIHMPLFSSRVDEEFVKSIELWIENLDQQ